jgi:hypothetical protein
MKARRRSTASSKHVLEQKRRPNVVASSPSKSLQYMHVRDSPPIDVVLPPAGRADRVTGVVPVADGEGDAETAAAADGHPMIGPVPFGMAADSESEAALGIIPSPNCLVKMPHLP